ncbi:MAG: transposase [Anaerolineaceae bacterium]|nr:transposase [Anaerolineaceae bacterium]
MVDYIRLLVSIPPKYSLLNIVGCLKVKNALLIFDRYANLMYKYVI